MIKFEHVTKRYNNDFTALRDINFFIDQSEWVFLTGHSGAGKSTILKMILGFERTSHGEIQVAGHKISELSGDHLISIRQKIGVVLQTPRFLVQQTVFENVELPLQLQGIVATKSAKRVRAALDKVGLLSKEKCFPDELSAGEQQRLSIAQAIVKKPTILIADEPTGNLDPFLSNEVMKLFGDLQSVGVTVLVATHDLHLVQQFGKRVLTLDSGQLLRDSL